MTLIANVQSRFSAQYLLELTNPDDTDASSTDTTVLGLAVTDAEAYFKVYAQVAYDDDDARHVAIGVIVVESFLHMWSRRNASERDRIEERIISRLKDLSRVTSRKRITPTTNSQLTPSQENATGRPLSAAFDDERWGPFIPNNHILDPLYDNR